MSDNELKNELSEHQQEKYIFFLKLNSELPRVFFKISRLLSGYGIDLLPITLAELQRLELRGKPTFILSLCTSFQHYKNFLIGRRYYLDQSLVKGKHRLIDVTSFSPIINSSQLLKKNRYMHVQLPINLEDLIKKIAVFFYSENRDAENWPGGKRAKLPELKERL